MKKINIRKRVICLLRFLMMEESMISLGLCH